VLDRDGSQLSRKLIDAFRATGYFRVDRMLDAEDEIRPLLERSEAQIVLVIPPDFSDRISSAERGGGPPAPVQAVVDGSDANTATVILNYARGVVRSFADRAILQDLLVRPPLSSDTRVWYNEELESRNMIVPGLVAVIMMIIAAMLTSLTIAREWERGTMEQLASTPVSRLEVVLGKLLPYLAIGMIDVATTSVLGVALFDVPFRGSATLLMVMSFFFLLGSLGLGMFISARARSQLLATQVAMIATFLPAFLLSGFMFAIEVMPRALRAFTYLIPARYFVVVTRGIFLKGVGIPVLHVQGLLMVLYAVVGLAAAVASFKKELR
jgi:ABC-2 type transport system permease protein